MSDTNYLCRLCSGDGGYYDEAEALAKAHLTDLDTANARIKELEAELRIIHLRDMPCTCSCSYSNTGSTFTRCRRCAEIDELWAAREAVPDARDDRQDD